MSVHPHRRPGLRRDALLPIDRDQARPPPFRRPHRTHQRKRLDPGHKLNSHTAYAFRRDHLAREGRRRQHRAVRAAGDRTEALRQVTAPSVVVHGTKDPMCHSSGGLATAEAIPGARLVLVPGMGHDLPRGAWPQLIEAIASNAALTDASDAPEAYR